MHVSYIYYRIKKKIFFSIGSKHSIGAAKRLGHFASPIHHHVLRTNQITLLDILHIHTVNTKQLKMIAKRMKTININSKRGKKIGIWYKYMQQIHIHPVLQPES